MAGDVLSFGTMNTSQNRFFWRGAYSAGTIYNAYDVVSYLGSAYIALTTQSGVVPTTTGSWDQMTSAGAVTSVAGRVGNVLLSATDLTNGVTGTGSVVLANSPVISRAFIGNLNSLRVVDGSTFTTIQAAINDLPAGGGAVYIPAGTYVISAALSVPSNVTLYGDGSATIIQLANGVNSQYAIVNAHASTTGDSNIVVRDLVIDGNKANQSPSPSQRTGCIQLQKVTSATILRTECRNAYNNIVQVLDGCSFIYIDDNYVHDNTQGNGIVVGTLPMTIGISDVFIRGNRVGPVSSADAIFTTGYIGSTYAVNRVVIANNSVFDTGDVSIEIGVGSTNVSCTGNRCTMNGHGPTGIMVRGALNVSVCGNQVNGTGTAINEDGVYVWGDHTLNSGGGGDTPCANVNVSGNTLTSLSRSGVTVTAGASGDVNQVSVGPNTIVNAGTNVVVNSFATNVYQQNNSDGLVGTVGSDLTFSPDTTHFAHFTRPVSFSHSSGVFTPDTGAESHIRTTGAANALTIESTNDASVGINIKDTVQNWGFALRSDKSEAVVLRNITSSTDAFTFATGGAFTAVSSVQGTVLNATTGFQVNGAATAGNVLRGNGTNFVSAVLTAADLSNGASGTGSVVLNSAPTIANPVITGTITAPAFVSSTANPASIGQVRLAAGDLILFRNAANTSDINGIQKKADDSIAIGSTASGVSITGKVVLYNNIATAGTGLAPVYWTVGLTGQTASVGTTNITTSAGSGLYKIIYYLKTTTAGTGGTVSLTLNWNDGTAMTITTGTASLSSAAGVISGVQVVKAGAASTISYATTVSGASGTPQYSLDIAIQQVK